MYHIEAKQLYDWYVNKLNNNSFFVSVTLNIDYLNMPKVLTDIITEYYEEGITIKCSRKYSFNVSCPAIDIVLSNSYFDKEYRSKVLTFSFKNDYLLFDTILLPLSDERRNYMTCTLNNHFCKYVHGYDEYMYSHDFVHHFDSQSEMKAIIFFYNTMLLVKQMLDARKKLMFSTNSC